MWGLVAWKLHATTGSCEGELEFVTHWLIAVVPSLHGKLWCNMQKWGGGVALQGSCIKRTTMMVDAQNEFDD